ncbi:nucleotide exchange factor sil1 [Conoideocrella luteorostrata]|uniref:Nucleotide exchange factor SIL1 n=1 Tax=Conoideocrella luteorostrata TaxID=1105319 RepID=A0AAJ0FVX0_9HYPO|nr:nucleotide exchange factor sil1 [Conoideocrella luteorostrata]
MAPSRSKPVHLQMMLVIVFSLLVCIFAAPAFAQESASSESTKPDLICHTSKASECYPRIFQPTDEFQTVHDDQEIPSGLHVRLNIWTGQKEAKINVSGEGDPSLEGLPVDRAVVMVDPEQQHQDTPRIPKGAPAYEPVGKVKGPEHESVAFHEGLKMLKKGVSKYGPAFGDALEGLEELSHDLYYGLKIAEDSDAVKALFCLMSGPQLPAAAGAIPRDQQAAAILAGALQNNPTALKEVTKAWPKLVDSKCRNTNEALRISLYSSVVPSQNNDGTSAQQAAARVKSKVAVINGLLKDDSFRTEFLKESGMASLLKVLMPQQEEWAGAQRKVGQLVLDNFLDQDMGAVLGQWPKTPKLADKQCSTEESQTAEGCWDYHVARIVKATKASKGEWSRELNDRLAAVRKQQDKDEKHREL